MSKPSAKPPVEAQAKAISAARGPVLATLGVMDTLGVDSLVLLIAQDERPLQGAAGLLDWRMCGWLSQELLRANITGKRGERVLTWPAGRLAVSKVFLLGAGPLEGAVAQLGALLLEAASVTAAAGCKSVALGACVPLAALEGALQKAQVLSTRVKVILDGSAM